MRLDSLHSPTLLGWRYMGIRVSGSQAILRTEDTGISKDPGVHTCTHVLRTPYSPILEYSERRHPAFLIENAPRPGSGMRCIRPSQSEAS
jgi:hypothetical protein